MRPIFCSIVLVIVTSACHSQDLPESPVQIGPDLFRHHYIARDLPGRTDWGYGCSVMADFDRDGDLDYAFTGQEAFYWFEYTVPDTWQRHKIGTMPIPFLGATAFDVDQDGWQDIVIGGLWYRNSQHPTRDPFERYQFDSRIVSNIHDVVVADMNGDGNADIVLSGEETGLFWYDIPKDPTSDSQWEKTTITLDVLVSRDHIHAGFFPNGIGDLDDDGDNDLVLPDRWLENVDANGTEWLKHSLPFGKRGSYGLSARSWIVDLDGDGDNDIVMTDCDQKASRAAWLENDGNAVPKFTAHFLPQSAAGVRGSFHSLFVGDFDNDADADIFTCDQEDDTLSPEGAFPRWYVWQNVSKNDRPEFVETIVLDNKLGGHDARVGDVDGDGDLDIVSKVWNLWPGSANGGREHGDFLENLLITAP